MADLDGCRYVYLAFDLLFQVIPYEGTGRAADVAPLSIAAYKAVGQAMEAASDRD